jgi:uncharacterized protein YndB with AHSA1/START domain
VLKGRKDMAFSVCPATTVAAPVETVWELLSDLTQFDVWWDARTERIVPEGAASPGQMLYAKTSAFGRTWDVTLRVDAVHPDKHQIQFHISLPLGLINDNTITCAALDSTSCRMQFG